MTAARTDASGLSAGGPGGGHGSAGGGDSAGDRRFPAACSRVREPARCASARSVSLSLQNHVPGSSCRGPPGHGVRPAPGLLTAVQPGSPVGLASPSTRPSRQPAPLRPSCCRGEDAGHREPGAMRRRGACQWGPRRTPEARVPPQRAGSPQWSEPGWSPEGEGVSLGARRADSVPRLSGRVALPSGTACRLRAHLLSSTERSLRGVERKTFNFPSNLSLWAQGVIPGGVAVGRSQETGCPQLCTSAPPPLEGPSPMTSARALGHVSPVDSSFLRACRVGQWLEHLAGNEHMQHTRVCVFV